MNQYGRQKEWNAPTYLHRLDFIMPPLWVLPSEKATWSFNFEY